MSMICPNSLTGYTLVSVMDYHIMPNNFNALFCCGCEITHVENSGKESPTTEFLYLLCQKIHLTVISQEVRKELRHVLFLKNFQS